MALIFDIETDGLLDTVSKVHCLVVQDTEDEAVYIACEEDVPELLRMLMDSDLIVGHNVIRYDIPVIQKLYPWFTVDQSKVLDTLVLARLIYSDVKETDTKLMKRGKLPGKLFGSHSLEAWGYRLGDYKGDYVDWYKEQAGDSYQEGDEWKTFSQEMLDYCVQDVSVTAKLYNLMYEKPYAPLAIELEHQVAWLMAKQERNGFHFDEVKGAALYATLCKRREELEIELREYFGSWVVELPDFIPKRDNKTLGYKQGVPVKRSKTVMFNPGSRDHISNRLMTLYGWEPTEFTEKGKPKVDEVVMSKLTYPPCKLLTEYLLVQKRISQLAEGDQAWLKLCRGGRIHGSVNTNGAVTGRCTHAYPNVTQVPANGSPYGKDCRSLFKAPEGWVLVGADASGLELRCLAHFMARWDGGAYSKVLLEGDIHTANQKAAGLPSRDQAKTFIYAFL